MKCKAKGLEQTPCSSFAVPIRTALLGMSSLYFPGLFQGDLEPSLSLLSVSRMSLKASWNPKYPRQPSPPY